MTEWVKKRKGCAIIYTHPTLDRAIVDRKGFGAGPSITYDGKAFDTVMQAKEYALASITEGNKE